MSRPALILVFMISLSGLTSCKSLSYSEPDAPPQPPHVEKPAAAETTPALTWSQYANQAREALRVGDLEAAESNFLASLSATAVYGDRDVRRKTALANPARLVEAYQASGQLADAERITDAVLAEAQGSKPFPLEAWTGALSHQLDLARDGQGPESELERAQRIAEIHLGPLRDATVEEVALRQRVGRILAGAGDLETASTQLTWAAHACRPLLRMPLDDRIELQYDASEAAKLIGDLTSAEFLLRDALELARGGGHDGAREAAALNQLGWFLVEQDHVRQALPLLEEARSLVDQAGTPPGLRAATLDSLAVALHRAGQLEEANEVFALAIAARDASSPEEQASMASIDAHWAALRAALHDGASTTTPGPAQPTL